MDGVYDRRAPKLDEKPLPDRTAAAERERRLDAAIKAWNEFDEKHGSFADDYVKDIL
ncbi:type II toxin-antitoxin system CcdA family antitoxin [Azospirillum sp. CT11-132]|uniref:type II toxin-antitoxin system CcdA family antitoxin n=1 Tax=Azospirillum sp. CT11-132 TaxID=3396317 RepID=UPI0039A5C5B6